MILEQTEAIVSGAGKDAVVKEKAVARNVKSVNKYKIKVEFGNAPMEDLMVSYIDRKLDGKIQLTKLTKEMVDSFVEEIVVYGEERLVVKWRFSGVF